MRSIAVYALVAALAACANSDPGWSSLDTERDACAARAMASPGFKAARRPTRRRQPKLPR